MNDDGRPGFELRKRVVLIDLSSLFWQAYMINSESKPQQARSITLENVKRCIGEGSPLVAICTDEGRSFRKDVSPDYKANREKQPEMAYAELARTKERLRSDGYLLWGCEGFEADDIISTACDWAVRAGHEVRVCSADKDMLALIGPSVDVLRTFDWTVWNVSRFVERFKIQPSSFTDWLSLKGDSSDNIPGAPGVGDVKASELIGKFGTIAKMYRAIDSGENITTPKLLESLKENRAAVELSRKLVELRFDAPINFNQIYETREPLPPTDETALPHERKALEAIAEADKILAESQTEGALVYSPPAESVTSLSWRDVVMQKKMIAECMRAVMKKDIHYGVVPGTSGKPSLYKAGADTLGFMFRLRAEYETDKEVMTPDFIYYRIRCKLTHIPTGKVVATGMGSCNSRESKYKRFSLKKCPKCEAEAIILGNPDYERDQAYKGGWICHGKRGGCGAKFKPNDEAISRQATTIADPSDLDNTLLKMAMKRSRVDGILTGTAAGDFFTQDIEDLDVQLIDASDEA